MFNCRDGNGTKVYVWFNLERKGGKPKTVVCKLKYENSDNNWDVRSVARCNYEAGDCFDKAQGRRIALGRALKEVFPGPPYRGVRTLFWREYYKRGTIGEQHLPGRPPE